MRARGINYDVGFLPGWQSRPRFEPDAVRRDLTVIADELHCDAVRISGGDPDRLTVAAEYAAATGLEVWYAPFPVDLTPDRSLALMAECAERAEAIRRTGATVVFVAGCETSMFGDGYLPGDTYADRIQTMASAEPAFWQSLGGVLDTLNQYHRSAVAVIREHFGGLVTYAAGPWEFIDWEPFDVVGVDAYRAAYNRDTFREELRAHREHGKPVAVTEFGTCAYRGAGDLGGMAWSPPPDAVYDEQEQVRYFTELMDIYQQEGIDAAFWFTFAGFGHPGEADIRSYGVVRMLDATRWEPKAVFATMAARYGHPEN
jgi:hypothetical protein